MLKMYRSLLLFVMLSNFSMLGAKAGQVYQWIDAEGIDQFSNRAPPISCQTPSCQKLHQKFQQKLSESKKQRFAQARELFEKEQEQLRKQEVIEKTTKDLPSGVLICKSFSSILEYFSVEQEKNFLIKDGFCELSTKNLKYSYIQEIQKFTKIRIYQENNTSSTGWVESLFIKNSIYR